MTKTVYWQADATTVQRPLKQGTIPYTDTV